MFFLPREFEYVFCRLPFRNTLSAEVQITVIDNGKKCKNIKYRKSETQFPVSYEHADIT